MAFDKKDAVLLVADRDIEATVTGLLSRTPSLDIRKVTFDVFRHPYRDSGCRTRAAEFLRPMADRYAHALVLFDHDGCGSPDTTAEELENMVEQKLAPVWFDRAGVVVLEPELESWVWSDSPEVARILGWAGSGDELIPWLRSLGYWPANARKPVDPKAAMIRTLQETRKRRSAAIFEELAARVSFRKCTDRAFLKMCRLLQSWFECKPGAKRDLD
ncbi:MAG: hypothetical protein FLDDKLPJ_00135 [Phycisphaerae bacterium]|nr:hypothetical protein [Phycisphaerae bacterium]